MPFSTSHSTASRQIGGKREKKRGGGFTNRGEGGETLGIYAPHLFTAVGEKGKKRGNRGKNPGRGKEESAPASSFTFIS